ncbi:unnamed protein product [Parnassius apollo]|uniref:(apollo) hypothetical protein n=1 Tax=Parnassius apollo TaxID=110799 RepID=A0A8S3W470_PARAO|nr:unnamed protein product [Parnassius apollo]
METQDVTEDTVYITKIQKDVVGKYPEIDKLREDLIRAKNVADEERFQRQKYEMKLKDLELKLNSICTTALASEKKESQKIADEEISSLKIQVRDAKEEIEEMRITVREKNEQLEEYRLKIQFQEKLQELAPLPDLLKGAQIQLQEAKQMQKLAEDSSQQLSGELNRVKEKLVLAINNLNQEKADKFKILEDNASLKLTIDKKHKEIDGLSRHIDELKCNVLRLEEKLIQEEKRFEEKAEEYKKIQKELEDVKTEDSRALTRCKERSESMRRYMQTQISELERQLVQSRAQSRACHKERDEIRQRMQTQINNLQENFELVEIRFRALQTQVASLKNNYSIMLADEDDCCDFNKITT